MGTVKGQDSFIQPIDSRRRLRGRHFAPLIAFVSLARRRRTRRFVLFIALVFLALPSRAHASMFHGETLDSVANVIAWFAFIIVPPVLIVAFLAVHIIPEKIAESRHHPQL